MIANIIRIPERTSAQYEDNYWKIYEESYQDENKLNDFTSHGIFSSKMTIDQVAKDIDKIYDVRFNFYKKKEEDVLSYLILAYYEKFLNKNDNILEETVSELFKSGTINNFIKIYMKSCVDCDKSLLNKFTNEVNKNLSQVDNEGKFIKFQYFLNKLLQTASQKLTIKVNIWKVILLKIFLLTT